MEPTFFVTRKAASLQVRGPSKRGYTFEKGKPVRVSDVLDLQNFRARRDTLVEVDAGGHPVERRPFGGPITGRDLQPKSYRKFGSGKPESQPEPTKPEPKPEKVVRTSKPKPAEEAEVAEVDEGSEEESDE